MSRDGSGSSPWTVHRLSCRYGTLAVAGIDPGNEPSAHRRESSNPPVVLLHGFTGSHRSWDRVARSLAGASRVLAPDLPGHGESYATGERDSFSLEATASVLRDVLARLGVSSCTLVGYSMGARLALFMALTVPGLVSRLVLESVSPGLEHESDRAPRREADDELARYACERGIEAFVDRWERTPVLAAERDLDPRTRAELRRQRLSSTVEGLAASLRGMGVGSQPWLGGRLGEIGMPVLLVTGESDAKFTEISRQMAACIPLVRHEIVPRAGHNVHLSEPELFARLVGRFATTSSRASERASSPSVKSSEEPA